MSKKLTITYVREQFEKEGYILLSEVYINNNTKLNYICPKGHKHSVTWAHWNTSKSRCPYCAGQGKPTIDEVRVLFENEGYMLNSVRYINSKTKLKYTCPKGHLGYIRLNDWNSGYRCKKCGIESATSILQNDYNTIKISFEARGYTLLSKEYKNAFTKLNYICPKGHKHSVTWAHWNTSKSRCPYCAGQGKPTLKQIRDSFEKEHFVLLSDEYKNSKTKLHYICSEGHEGFIRWNDWQQGHRCKVCCRDRIAVQQRNDYLKIRKSFEDEQWELYDFNYTSAHQKLVCVCPNGHKQTKSWNKWNRGQRCKVCSDINNSGENCYLWKGGISFEPYCEAWKDQEYKQDIRDRDGNRCLNPYCSSNNPNDLTIHHIDYDKKNCKPSNLITVCRSCNSRANTDRTWHKHWYKAILKNRYQIGA